MTATQTAAQAASAPAACRFDQAPGRGRSASGHARGPREDASAIPGGARSPPPEPPGRTTRHGRHEQSAVSAVTPIEPARGPAGDLVPVTGHPPFQPGVTRVLLRGRPDAGP